MTTSLIGKDISLWVTTTRRTNYPQLDQDGTFYDLAIVGGGITGIAAAYEAQRRGLKTVLVEKSRLAEWTTGSTTAKLTSQHYLAYDFLTKRHGPAIAQAYADANQAGIESVERLSKQLGIDCEFTRQDAYVYTNDALKIDALKAEVAAAQQLGLPASFVTTTELPFEITGAVCFTDQAQFHPRKFLLGLVDAFIENGGTIYEHTEAEKILPGSPHTLVTKQGNIVARHILQATGEPFWGGDILEGKMWLKMSYALAVTLKDEADYPEGMYITTDDPMRSLRSAYYGDTPVMIFGGESHEYDDATYDETLHYNNLAQDVREKFDVKQILFHWLAGDYMPYDRLPYIGALPSQPNIYAITGYRAWGLAWAMSATEAIIDDITGHPATWVTPFSFDRLTLPVNPDDITARFE